MEDDGDEEEKEDGEGDDESGEDESEEEVQQYKKKGLEIKTVGRRRDSKSI